MAQDDLLSAGAVASLLGVSTSSIRAWAAKGLIKGYRTPGGHLRFRRSDVEHALRPEKTEVAS